MNILRAERAVHIIKRPAGALHGRPDTDNCGDACSLPWRSTTPSCTQPRSAANLRSHWCCHPAAAAVANRRLITESRQGSYFNAFGDRRRLAKHCGATSSMGTPEAKPQLGAHMDEPERTRHAWGRRRVVAGTVAVVRRAAPSATVVTSPVIVSPAAILRPSDSCARRRGRSGVRDS
jgi:hypothetical protein